jgi:hypothetical protein
MLNKKTLNMRASLDKKINTMCVKFDGKSYKLNKKKVIFNFRFNKSNINVLKLKNLNMVQHKFKKKLYIYPINNLNVFWGIHKHLNRIRNANTYTQRGLLKNSSVFFKRTGRVSGYV